MNHKDLQTVLEYLNKYSNQQFEVANFKSKLTQYDKRACVSIFEKLYKDGYIDRDTRGKDNVEAFYHQISYDGIIFLEQGGYLELNKQEVLKTKKLQKENYLRLTVGIASVVVGVYYLIQIVKEIVSWSLWFCRH